MPECELGVDDLIECGAGDVRQVLATQIAMEPA
jgi:hypothetical protein